ncbi:MAG TPA: transcription elongation factor GreA [Candidatus Paceibacterota bacterium]|jgi:transcription elongation factor GreA|nr:transcription elongation factor GreA [Candidatus Paceibacterota bacterium]
MSQKDYITEEKRKALEDELKELKGSKRKEILEALAYAKSLGDLSENAEYHQAREDQSKLEERIAHVEKVLRSAQVVSGGGGDTVDIGSKVSVRKEETGEEKTYTIVGSQEGDMKENKISNRSPFGEALFGKKKGDSVAFNTPKGPVNYKIIEVS